MDSKIEVKNGAKIISIISGKGGTGKTLLSVVLGRALAREGLKVLLIDFDIFVRGLTILLSEYGLSKYKETGLTISDLFLKKEFDNENLMIHRFYELDIVPAIEDINKSLNFDIQNLSSTNHSEKVTQYLIRKLGDQYDIIIFDNRASLDSPVYATCKYSDLVISVAEDDSLCLHTNSNLINHLRYDYNIENIYTIINKGRKVTKYEDLSDSFRRTEYNYVGIMPFDIEIMEDFGKEKFWYTVFETLYFRALIDAWNNISKFEDIKGISIDKYDFPPDIFMSPDEGKYSTVDRMLRGYSLIMIFMGIILYGTNVILKYDYTISELMPIFLILIGFATYILSTSGLRKRLIGKSELRK